MSKPPSPARLEAFSDGVLAVIITIMVLDLHVPRAAGVDGFVSILPALGVYLLSFVFIGIYWVNHHHLLDRLRHVDALILWANLSLLFALSLLPFFTAYLVEKHEDGFSVGLYAACMLFPGVTFQLLSLAIRRHLRRQPEEVSAEERVQHRVELGKGVVSMVAYACAIAFARTHPHVALGIIAAVTLIWLTPALGTRKAIDRELTQQSAGLHDSSHAAATQSAAVSSTYTERTRD